MPSPTNLHSQTIDIQKSNAEGTDVEASAPVTQITYGNVLSDSGSSEVVSPNNDASGRPRQKAQRYNDTTEVMGVFNFNTDDLYFVTRYDDDGTSDDYYQRKGPSRLEYKHNCSVTAPFKNITTTIMQHYVGRITKTSHITSGQVS